MRRYGGHSVALRSRAREIARFAKRGFVIAARLRQDVFEFGLYAAPFVEFAKARNNRAFDPAPTMVEACEARRAFRRPQERHLPQNHVAVKAREKPGAFAPA